jgi:gamma-glutamylcyclotransferase (GGCT)/AIG2-like uncharacterized protein YtfP
MTEYLFSYGTLLPEHAPQDVAWVIEKLRRMGEGYICGKLYDLGDYPGAVLDPTASQRVFGIVFRLPNDFDSLRALDRYEEFYPESPDKSLFVRKHCPVTLREGGVMDCWMYEYNRPPGNARIVKGGRYRNDKVNIK